MKLTKKQLSALQRIVGREQTRYDEIQSEALAGVHPSEKHFAITDGTMVVLFAEQPEGIPVGDRTETYDKYVQDYLKDANASLVVSPPGERREDTKFWGLATSNYTFDVGRV